MANPVVYVVEDDEAVRNALALLICSQGWEVRVFDSASAFLEAGLPPKESLPCLLLDLDLGDMNGAELQEYLQAQEHNLPTIVVTAKPDHSLARRASDAGARAVVSKPFEATDLIREIEQALRPAS
ncbi:response regulator [Aquisalimonas sp.]|uniref:response regulator transcription factor n=1 Tax=Aquisalimonas sp. TaxID=1872621 RepID=UPI0025C3454B|nr:response regulator [Aquisalimonas sp.]